MNTSSLVCSAGAPPARSSRRFPWIAVSLLACLGVCVTPDSRAANLTLSKALIDSLNSEIDFSQSTIGSGSLAVPNTLAPGDTVFIEAHTRKRLVLKNLIQGTEAAPVTVTNSGGQFIVEVATMADLDGKGITIAGCQHVILKGTPGPGYLYGIKVGRTRYLKNASFNGLKITDNGSASTPLRGSNDIEVTNLEICNTGFSGIQAKCEAAMPAGYVMDKIHIHHNYIHDTLGEGLYIGWTSAGHHDMADIEINHNTLANIGWDAIQLNTCVSNGRIHHNTVIGYGVDSDAAQAEINNPNYWQNEGIGGGRNELKIYNNWIEATGDLAGAGVFQYVYKNLEIYNNVFIHTGVSGDPAFEPGIYLADNSGNPVQPGATVKIINNTIITPEGPGVKENTAATSYYYNNIVAAPRNASAYTTGTITNSGSYVHVATVAAAGFVNAAADDYNLTTSSPAYDAGTNVATHGVTTDFVGMSRPQGAAYDIGAYERIGAQANTILTPTAVGTATGSQFCAATGAFNEQPVWNASTSQPVGVAANPHDGTITGYANRCWFIDFGPDYAKVRITQMWTRYRPSTSGNQSGFGAMWWDNDKDNVNDGTAATGLKFNSAQGMNSSATQQWIRDADFSSAPRTPAQRYLLVPTLSAPTDRSNEFAFVGYVVP